MDDYDCPTCHDTGVVARRTTYPMTIVGPGPVPGDAKGVVEDGCPDCNPLNSRRNAVSAPKPCPICFGKGQWWGITDADWRAMELKPKRTMMVCGFCRGKGTYRERP